MLLHLPPAVVDCWSLVPWTALAEKVIMNPPQWMPSSLIRKTVQLAFPIASSYASCLFSFFHAWNLSIWMLTTKYREESQNLQILISCLYSASVLQLLLRPGQCKIPEGLTCSKTLSVRAKLFIWRNKTKILQISTLCSDPLSFFPGVPLYLEWLLSSPSLNSTFPPLARITLYSLRSPITRRLKKNKSWFQVRDIIQERELSSGAAIAIGLSYTKHLIQNTLWNQCKLKYKPINLPQDQQDYITNGKQSCSTQFEWRYLLLR